MIVVFVSDADKKRVRKVLWQQEPDLVVARSWFDNGLVQEEAMAEDTLLQAIDSMGIYSHAHPAEVDDLESAFKYLGKSADLVETLPEANISNGGEPEQPN